MSVRGSIERLANGTYPVARQVASSYDENGRLVDAGAITNLEITAVVQPVSGDDLKQLAEGQMPSDRRVVFSLEELRTRTPANDPDLITIDGRAWEVVNVETWTSRGETHWKAIVARVEA